MRHNMLLAIGVFHHEIIPVFRLVLLIFLTIYGISQGQGLLSISRTRSFCARSPANHLDYPFFESKLTWLLYGSLGDRSLSHVYLALIVLGLTGSAAPCRSRV